MALASGSRLGPYEILSPIGAGGMGEVYRARDTRLGRDVAVKVLPEALSSDPLRLRRFEQEARSTSALNHPNIVTIHDVGQEGAVSYIAMELVEGRSLREALASCPLPPKKAIDIASQVSSGLAKAHASGIVHRDLKPENVMVTSEGLVKILDFGLAKLSLSSPSNLQSQIATETRQTEPGVVLGTVGYMSPEQAAGRSLDFRSDQFSFGAILYEMLTGRRAFQRATAVETLTAILNEEPPPLAALSPSVPVPLSTIVKRCLAKDPEERYASTRDLARDLADLRDRPSEKAVAAPPPASRGLGFRLWPVAISALAIAAIASWLLLRARPSPGPRGGERSIAILPFQNLGGRSEDEYFSDGMTESLITDLAKVKGLLVIARNSVFPYKKKSVDVRKVGEDLHVRYVLEGSVQRSGDSVRVTAQLVDAETGYHVWADKYDRPMRDIFALQDDISKNIIASLRVALRPVAAPPAAPSPKPDLEAYDAYLRGVFYFNRFEWEQKDKGIPFFERAIALDPGFAPAHAALATAYAKKAFEKDPEGTWRAKAREETEKALSLDPNLAEAYLARGNLAWTLGNGFPHEKAAADFRRALKLNPNLEPAHKALAGVYYHVGLLDEAVAEYRKASRIDPYDLDSLYRLPRIALYQQNYAEALAGFEATPEFRSDFLKPLVLAHLGRTNKALTLARAELTNTTHSKTAERSDNASTLSVLFALTGDRAGAEERIAEAVRDGEGNSHFHHAAYNIATAYALLGGKKDALVWLEKTAKDGMPCYPLFEKDPYLDRLRGVPAFRSFLTKQRAQWERFRKTL
ncbi:MAG: protein kinase [Chloroflexota bacterium]|nr:protein kinase [Chloroflexota bacterium]